MIDDDVILPGVTGRCAGPVTRGKFPARPKIAPPHKIIRSYKQ
jgi:hypothetical protein